jgi:Flp pilus assembly protein TadB
MSQRSPQQEKKLRIQIAYAVSVVVVVGIFLVLGWFSISPLSVVGLLLLLSAGLFLWRYWKDTLASVHRIGRERRDEPEQ